MSDRPRFYVTTAIAYANNAPGLHTVYEVIGADVIARWHRMQGDETRFLTGTDEHSVNIAQSAEAAGLTPREFVDEKVGLFKAAEDALLISPDRFIRTTDPDHYRSAQEMVRRAYDNGDIYLGTYDGWYCPSEGFKAPSDLHETATGMQCPNHPGVPLQWLSERNWFFRLSSYQQRLLDWYEANPDFVQPDYRRNEMLGLHPPGPRGLLDQPRGRDLGHPVPDRARTAQTAQREDGSWDPEAGTIYVWYDALINYITGAGFPDDLDAFQRWWPADLHVIGKDIARFHTIYWPAMLWAAGIEAPEHVWVHGWLLVQGGERMSKSRGNFLDPHDVVAAFGADGARYVTLREVAFDRDTEVSWDSFVRRYNADLANDFGNLVNRTVSMVNRYLGGERPAPRPAGESPLAEGWADTLRLYRERARRLPPARRPGRAAGSSSAARTRRSTPSSPGPSPSRPRPATRRRPRGCARCWATSSRPAGSWARRSRRSCPTAAPRILEQLGYGWTVRRGRQRRSGRARSSSSGAPCAGAGPRDRRADAAVPARSRPRRRRAPRADARTTRPCASSTPTATSTRTASTTTSTS